MQILYDFCQVLAKKSPVYNQIILAGFLTGNFILYLKNGTNKKYVILNFILYHAKKVGLFFHFFFNF